MKIRTDERLVSDLKDAAIRELGLTNWARWTMFSHADQNRIAAKQIEIAMRILPDFSERFENRGGTYYDKLSGWPIMPTFQFYAEVARGDHNQRKFTF